MSFQGTRGAGSPASVPSPLSRLLVQDVGLHIGKTEVLHGISVEIRAGELFGLVGPNGSGKSSLLSILAGLRPKFDGRVEFQFADGSFCAVGALQTEGLLGVVFQNPSLDAKLSARENLNLTCLLHQLPRADTASRVEVALTEMGLGEAAHKKVSELSGGLRRRLDLARALLPRPSLLLLDEPTTGIDEASFRAFWERLHAYRKETGATLLLATHRPEEADACGRVALFARGKIVDVAEPAELKRKLARDVIVLVAKDSEAATRVEKGVLEALGGHGRLSTHVTEKRVLVEADDAHALVPRIVEIFPRGTLASVELRAASMSDVFLKVTGQHLEA